MQIRLINITADFVQRDSCTTNALPCYIAVLVTVAPVAAEVGSAVGRERPRVVVGSGGLYSNVCVIPEEVRSLGGRLVAYHFCQVGVRRYELLFHRIN